MRQFIAIPLPERVKQTTESLLKSFQEINGLKPVKPEIMHLTLLFLGDTGTEEKISELRKISFTPFNLSTTCIQIFPKRKPRLIWIELEKSDELIGLYNKIARLFGVNKEFKAHITLARIKRLMPQDYRMVVEKIDMANPLEIDLEVNRFNLYNSELRPEGPVHRIKESFPAKIS